MRNSILEAILLQHIPMLQDIKLNEAHEEALYKHEEYYKKLKGKLSEENVSELDKMLDCCFTMDCENSIAHFKLGFKIAFLIAAECFGSTAD